jgi:hypothetical protein
MSSVTNIAIWCAVGTAIATTGKFLDEYHLRTQTRGRIRTVLIRVFVFVEDGPEEPMASNPFFYRICTVLPFLLVHLLLQLAKKLFVNVLDAASDPKTSPFIYASSLLGLVVAVLGVIRELL